MCKQEAQEKTDVELKELKPGEMEGTHFLTGDPSWGENGPKFKLMCASRRRPVLMNVSGDICHK